MDLERGFIRFVKVFAALFTLAVIAIAGAYWWSNVPPSRPKSVPSTAVWLWGPNVGLPGPKRGLWLDCRRGSVREAIHCATTDKAGVVEYEGEFLLYPRPNGTTTSLEIDYVRMQHNYYDQALFIHEHLSRWFS